MKLNRIILDHILAHDELTLTFNKPVSLIFGPNGFGKSSIAYAIGLALTAESPLVFQRKDYGEHVHAGAKAGAIQLDFDDVRYAMTIAANGTIDDNHKGKDVPEALPYVIRPSKFADELLDVRKDFLFRLLNLDLSQEATRSRLLAKGCSEPKVDGIMPIVRAGFPKAEKRANEEASDSRGAWKALTGENYGSVKAETWRAPCPSFSGEQAAELHGLDKSIAATEAEKDIAMKRLGEAEHVMRVATQREQNMTALRELAAKLPEHTKLADKAAGEMKELEDELQDARQRAGFAPTPKPRLLPCPDCGAALCLQEDGSLATYPDLPKDPPHDPDAATSIPGIEKAIGLLRNVLSRHTKNRDEAKTAADNLAHMAKQEDAKPIDPAPIRDTIATLTTSIATMKKRQAELQQAQRALDEADRKTKAARQHHADVQDWLKIAAALSPDGIPGELLAEAIGPFNERLAQSAADADWQPRGEPATIELRADMSITLNGRHYKMRSRAERYFIDAIIAEAISHFSGLKFLVFDDADVLVGESWHAFCRWADVLGNYNEADTVLILVASENPPPVKDTQDSIALIGLAPVTEVVREAA